MILVYKEQQNTILFMTITNALICVLRRLLLNALLFAFPTHVYCATAGEVSSIRYVFCDCDDGGVHFKQDESIIRLGYCDNFCFRFVNHLSKRS